MGIRRPRSATRLSRTLPSSRCAPWRGRREIDASRGVCRRVPSAPSAPLRPRWDQRKICWPTWGSELQRHEPKVGSTPAPDERGEAAFHVERRGGALQSHVRPRVCARTRPSYLRDCRRRGAPEGRGRWVEGGICRSGQQGVAHWPRRPRMLPSRRFEAERVERGNGRPMQHWALPKRHAHQGA